MKLRLSALYDMASERPEGYVEDVVSRGIIEGEWLEISADEMEVLRGKYRPLPASPPQLPSLPRMVASAAQSIKNEAVAFLQGAPRVAEEEVARRLEVCRSCEFFIPSTTRCLHCGCFLNVKLRMRAQSCPVGKW